MRNPVFDIMKGIAILLMLIGHTGIPADGFLYNFIYSFHMPLFFILAGYFAKSLQESGPTFVLALKKDSARLLVPYLVTALAIITFTALRSAVKQDWSILAERAFGLFYVTWDSGPIWFLVALFCCRMLFRPMMRLGRWSLVVSIFISGSALLYAHHVAQLPFCILTALSAIVFYAVGWYYMRFGVPVWLIALCVLCWPYTILYSHIDLYFVRYGIYPLTILGACGGTYVIYQLCVLIERNVGVVRNILLWCGIHSLVILCFHTFDIYCCYVTMIMNGLFDIRLSYWPTQLIRDGFVFLFSWIYVTYLRPRVLQKNSILAAKCKNIAKSSTCICISGIFFVTLCADLCLIRYELHWNEVHTDRKY